MAATMLESNLKYIFFFLRKEKSQAAVEINVGPPHDRLPHVPRRSNLSPGDNTVSASPHTRPQTPTTLRCLTTLCSCV